MARPVKVKERDVRLSEILHTAERLFYEHGYNSVSVQVIIEKLGIAKGTFYHYFPSKQALVTQLVIQKAQSTSQSLAAAVSAKGGSGFERLRRFFEISAQWKAAQRDEYVFLLVSLYSEANLIFRNELTKAGIEAMRPVLAKWIGQLHAEQAQQHKPVLDATMLAEAVLRFIAAMGERSMPLVLQAIEFSKSKPTMSNNALIQAADWLELQANCVERMLDVEPGSLGIFNREAFMATYGSPQATQS